MKYILPKRFTLSKKDKEEAEGFYKLLIYFVIGMLIGQIFILIKIWLKQ